MHGTSDDKNGFAETAAARSCCAISFITLMVSDVVYVSQSASHVLCCNEILKLCERTLFSTRERPKRDVNASGVPDRDMIVSVGTGDTTVLIE